MASQTSSPQLYGSAFRFLGEFVWSILAVRGASSLFGTTSLRATLWMVVPTAAVIAVFLSGLTVRCQRRAEAMEERWRPSWAADAASD